MINTDLHNLIIEKARAYVRKHTAFEDLYDGRIVEIIEDTLESMEGLSRDKKLQPIHRLGYRADYYSLKYRQFLQDFDYNPRIAAMTKYWDRVEKNDQMRAINNQALKWYMFVDVCMDGVAFHSDKDAFGLTIGSFDSRLDKPSHIWWWTQLWHHDELSKMKSIVEDFQREHALVMKRHQAYCEKLAEKYSNIEVYLHQVEKLIPLRPSDFDGRGKMMNMKLPFSMEASCLKAAYQILCAMVEETKVSK